MREKRHTLTRALKNSAGVSLIEVLIAVAIFAIGISAVAVLQYKTVSGNTRGRMITDATTLAEREMERLMELTFTDGELTAGAHPSNPAFPIPLPYTVTWDVTNVDLDGDATNESKQVDVNVTAPQLGGNRDISFVFYKDNLK